MWNFKRDCLPIPSFVKAMVGYYYPTDGDVKRDTELQEWIKEIFIHCLLENKEAGIKRTIYSFHVFYS